MARLVEACVAPAVDRRHREIQLNMAKHHTDASARMCRWSSVAVRKPVPARARRSRPAASWLMEAGIEGHRRPSRSTRIASAEPAHPSSRAAASSWWARWSRTPDRDRGAYLPRRRASTWLDPGAPRERCELGIAIDSATAVVPLRDHPGIVSMEKTDTRKLEGQGLARSTSSRSTSTFISLKAVPLPWRWRWRSAMYCWRDQAGIRGGSRSIRGWHHPQRDGGRR